MGPLVGPVSCAVLGLTCVACGVMELSIAQIMGPGSSEALVSDGPVLIPWYGLPVLGIVLGAAAVAYRRRLLVAHRALMVGGVCLTGWFVVAALV